MNDIRSPAALALTDIVLTVFRMNGRLLSGGDRLVAPIDLTSARWQVLGAIALAGRPQTVPQIADTMGMTRQGAQKQVNRLEEDGFVESRDNPRHKRSPLYHLTDKGLDAYRKTEELNLGWVEALTDGLDLGMLRLTADVLNDIDRRLKHDTYLENIAP